MRLFINHEIEQITLADERYYKIKKDGLQYDLPSVTTYLEAFPTDKHLLKWYNQVKDPYLIMEEAGQIGSKVHQLIENILIGDTVEYDDSINFDVWVRVCGWFNWFNKLKSNHDVFFKPEWVERTVYDLEFNYAGTMDLLCMVDGLYHIFDWKTGSAVRLTAPIQVSAYAIAIQKELGIKIENCSIIHLNPEINLKNYKQHDYYDWQDYFKYFLNSRENWLLVNKNWKPKDKLYPLNLKLEVENVK